MKKTKSKAKAKGSVKRRSYSADERLLYFLGRWDNSHVNYPENTRLGRLQVKYFRHPSYLAGEADAKKRNKQRGV